ncbi:MAG: sulfatase activating formylglycine-generating enzyme, partial [Cellvibrionaceae bacterium]
QDLLGQYSQLSPELIIKALTDVGAPLDYLHQKGMIHGNVKPANIRMTPAGDVHLVDYGFTGLDLPPADKRLAAPERQQHNEFDFKVDVYSLGATLFTLLTGDRPPDPIKREVEMRPMPLAREINPDALPHLSLIASRALAADPEIRFGSVQAFIEGLHRPESRSLENASLAFDRDSPPQSHRMGSFSDPGSSANLGSGSREMLQLKSQRVRRVIQLRVLKGLASIFLIFIVSILAIAYFNQQTLDGGSIESATATTQSQVIAALTAIAPTITPTPDPTLGPTPTPAPLISRSGMRMIYMPGGVFRYGNNDAERDESPSILINLDPYYIDETEVTNQQYRQCVEADRCEPLGNGSTYHDDYDWRSTAWNDYPAIFVTWDMADNFCDWRGTRLPTEAEWERAAGYDPFQLKRTLYPWGEEFDGARLNYCDSGCPKANRDSEFNDGQEDTAPVASYPEGASPIGTFDMLGNVKEWVDDWYDRDYYSQAPPQNPRGPATGDAKVVRGGSWFSGPDELLVTTRDRIAPNVSLATVGFRCALPEN